MIESPVCVEITEQTELLALLERLERVILEHPVAAQAAFSALVAEGRAFAKTEEGIAWQQRLDSSPLIEKGRAVWEGLTVNVLEEDEQVVVPSRIVDAFVKLLHERALTMLLARLHNPDHRGANDAPAP